MASYPVRNRLRAELELARSYYKNDVEYVNALEKFVKQTTGEIAIQTNEELKNYYNFLKDYINHGFRLSPININTCNYIDDNNGYFKCDRCENILKRVENGETYIFNLKAYSIDVTNEYILDNNKFRKCATPTKRFNGDTIPLFLNKGGIIRETLIVLEHFKELPKNGIIEPEDIRITIPVTMINDTLKNIIIFAVDHKSKALDKLLNTYKYHYETNEGIYYNIRNRTFK